jgi:hypothetical protein
MRFYQVATFTNDGSSTGFDFYSDKRTAQRAVREATGFSGGKERGEMTEIEVTPTKAGILDALNRLASHADNG